MWKDLNELTSRLKKSKFRSKFHLAKQDIEYIKNKGIESIEEHANEFVKTRLKPNIIQNDGKQTPYKGHPVFIAQHATACCCRICLNKWHKIEKNKELSDDEIQYIVSVIMNFIKNELNQ